ncbi:MAG TPA: alpha-E domain-containing protein, partial [Opitutaceae bacterium]
VWISAGAEPPKPEITLLTVATRPVELRRVGNNLPSRLADNFFWLGRYAERADATARLLRSALVRFNPERTGGTWPVLAPLLATLEKLGLYSAEKREVLRQQPEALEAELLAAVFATDRAGSLHHTASELRRLAVLVRDRTSTDFWRVVRQFEERLAPPPATASVLAGDAIAVLNQALLDLAAFNGLANDNMTKSQGWRFLDMGRRIERSMQLCTLVDSVLSAINDDSFALLEATMEICDCSITYRSRYSVLPQLAAVCDLALLDDTNPRSLLYQLNQLQKHFDRLPPEALGPLPGPGKRLLIDSLARLKLADPCALGKPGQIANQTELARVVRHIGAALPQLSDTIAVNYFAHSSIAQANMEHEYASDDMPESKP